MKVLHHSHILGLGADYGVGGVFVRLFWISVADFYPYLTEVEIIPACSHVSHI